MLENSNTLISALSEDTRRYLTWLDTVDVTIDPALLLAGPIKSPDYPVWPRQHDNFHYPLGMDVLLGYGFAGVYETAARNAMNLEGNRREYLFLIAVVYRKVCNLMHRFANAAAATGNRKKAAVCKTLAHRAPGTFIEACQLYWFATVFRVGTATIGRIDQHLYPFLKQDLADERISIEAVKKIVAELIYRYERRGDRMGDTLQNITLGGSDSKGMDQTNELTYLFIEEFSKTNNLEPQINIRIHRNSAEKLKELLAQLQLCGTGNCTLFNDDAIIPGLRLYGRPEEIAADYCADGCSEIILDGHGETVFRYIDCVKAVEHTLFNGGQNVSEAKELQYYDKNKEYIKIESPVPEGKKTGNFLNLRTFESFLEAYLEQIRYQIETILEKPYNQDRYPIRAYTAALMPGVLESGIDPFSNEACYHTYGLFIGSLGTAVNSIAAVKKLVYDEARIDKNELLNALRQNFSNDPVLRKLCLQAPKFGNDDDEVDTIAASIASCFKKWVVRYKDRLGRPTLPGLYNHLFHHTAYRVGATPDGRRCGDPVGEHLSPTPGTASRGPTAIINSVTKINTGEQIFGSTLHLNIPRTSLGNDDNASIVVKALNDVFCAKNGCVLNMNVLNAEMLREAQSNPEQYEDLIVRVWGFSYYFCHLSKEMQNHVIARAELP